MADNSNHAQYDGEDGVGNDMKECAELVAVGFLHPVDFAKPFVVLEDSQVYGEQAIYDE